VGEPRSVTLSDGRVVEVWSEGDERGVPLLFHHGTPSSGLPYAAFVELARVRGIRLVSYSRPGYGASDRDSGRTVARCAGDAGQILDTLGIERCVTAGWSGGGPHALACAALLGGTRVRAAVTIAGAAAYGAPDLDFLADMGEENVEEFGAAVEGPDALEAWMSANAPPFASVSGAEVVTALGDLVSEVDRSSVTQEFGEFLAEEMRYALRPGWWGWFDDDLAFVRDWGFDVASISIPVTVWQGAQDRMVPFAHGRWLARHVPGARSRLLDDEGHLSVVVGMFGEILDDLVSVAGTETGTR
jgi:pimeloyl-ACP methyl ester carboxylesterase